MIEDLKTSADYDVRKKFVENFNKVPPLKYLVLLRLGIEMGQGINTKCAQTVAKFLNIPLEKVRIKPTNSFVSPNGGFTGSSMGSDLVCHAAMKACEILLKKMEPLRQEIKDPTWENVVTACHNQNILLTAQYQDKPGDELKSYDVWAVCVTEVDVDVLTGEYKIVRVDLAQDAGLSLSPEVDIGQIEGAFVMGTKGVRTWF
ncbi:xanthine dehydrogenase/oxidase-like [Folsomia candida]|uniref:xanthine dehydrogenase/oxidase-like n=1 Tax=Folsomia candida TaxID=158441 RepID=UPI001605205A|nr:xanthine dehydrogenase/oxidase-like [Folsomia candida]